MPEDVVKFFQFVGAVEARDNYSVLIDDEDPRASRQWPGVPRVDKFEVISLAVRHKIPIGIQFVRLDVDEVGSIAVLRVRFIAAGENAAR